MKTCDTCIYSGIAVGGGKELAKVCRRRPPMTHSQAIPGPHGQIGAWTATVWPTITENDWCGEHSAKIALAS